MKDYFYQQYVKNVTQDEAASGSAAQEEEDEYNQTVVHVISEQMKKIVTEEK